MDDHEALSLLSVVVESAKRTTEVHKPRFYKIYESATASLARISQHIENKNLRMCFFYFRMLDAVLEVRYSYVLQNRIKEQLEASANLPEELKEIASFASTQVTISVLGDEEGRDVIDIERLSSDLEKALKGLDEGIRTTIFSNILSAIRMVYDKFVEEGYKEMMEFYDNLLKCCKKGWQEVYDTLIEYMLRMDKEAIIWLRGK